MIDAMPNPVFLVDRDVSIIGLNQASQQFIGADAELILKHPAGEVLHCINASEAEGGCGRALACQDCLIRNSVKRAFDQKGVYRERVKMEILANDRTEEIAVSIIASAFSYNGGDYVLLQLENITELMELRELIPICSGCHDIRVDDEYWQKVDYYLTKNFSLKFSHGLCPDCVKKYYGDTRWYEELKDNKMYYKKKYKEN